MDTKPQISTPVIPLSPKPKPYAKVLSSAKNIGLKTWKWAKMHKIAAGIIFLIVLAIVYSIIRSVTAPKVSYVTEKAVRMNLKQTVSATGKVDSDSSVDLKFAAAGEVNKIYFNAGDHVVKDQIIVDLKHDQLSNQIKEAEAAVNLQKANYMKVVTGAKKEEILISIRKVENAQVSYDSAVKNLATLKVKLATDIDSLRTQVKNLTQTLADTKISTNLEISNAKTNLLSSLNGVNTKSSYSISQARYVLDDPDLKNIYSAQDYYAMIGSRDAVDAIGVYLFDSQQDYLTAANSQSDTDITNSVATSDVLLGKVEELLKFVAQGLDATPVSSTVTDTRLNTFKTIIKTEQDSNNAEKIDLQSKNQIWTSAIINQPIRINAAQSTLDNANSSLATALANNDIQLSQAQSNIDAALTQLNLAKADLALTQSRATSSDLAIAQAQIDQAQSALDRLNTQLKDYEVTAPFDGVVGKIAVKENQTVTMADVIASIVGVEKFKISVDIPESDITKIAIGNAVSLTLDAYSNDVLFTGKVDRIDTTETNIADVVYYKVDVVLDASDKEIKQGMSANIDILTNKRDNALVVPARAVLENSDGTKYVRVLSGGQPLKATVTTGLRGDEGKIEILSGLMEGDLVITFEKTL